MGIISWIIFGFIVGLIAKLLTPGRDPGGFIVTILIGIGGSLLGGFVGRALHMYGPDRSRGGFFMSILGAVVLLAIYHAIMGGRRKRVA
jgi:uncharacterized membrane protein YeaQ/YmgE (transglycosylase-associated protein family)